MGIRQRAGGWYRRNRILTWMCLIIMVNQLGFGSIIPVVPLYAASFGVSQTLIGLTIAVYGFARFAASMPAGWIADLFGRRWSLATGGSVTVLGNLICGLAPNYEVFLVGRFIAGMGAAIVLTSGQIVLTDITTRENRGRTMAIYQGVFLFAVGFGPLPGGLLAEYGGLAFPFFVYSAVGSIVTLLALVKLGETRQIRGAGDAGRPRPRFVSQIRLITADRAFLMVCLISFGSFFARTGGLFNLIPIRAETVMGLGPGQIGLGLAMISIVGLVLAYPSGWLVDRYGRKVVIVPSTLIAGVSMAMFAFSPNLTWFLVSSFVWAVGGGISGAAPGAYAADVAPRGMQAAAMGTYRTISESGYFVGPMLLGFSADWFGTGSSLVGTATFVCLTGVAFALFAPETRWRSVRRASEATEPSVTSTPKPP